MAIHRFGSQWLLALGLLLSYSQLSILAQPPGPPIPPVGSALEHQVRPGSQSVTLTVNTSKILTLDGKQVPRALVQNPDVVNAIAISPNQIQISGLKAGVTQVNLWDDDAQLYTVDVIVSGDARELRLLLQDEFPNASLRVRPLASSVVLSGWVDNPDVISRIVRMAEDYYPKVINNIRVGDNQQVMLHVQVMEVSRTKLRQLGFDWAAFGSGDFLAQGVSGLIQETTANAGAVVGNGNSTVTFGVANGSSTFFGVIDALKENDLVKVLAEPVLTTISGRAAAFNAGGEFPIVVPQGLGQAGVEFKEFGTRVDFVPIVLGNGNIRLEVRPQVSEINNALGVDLNGFQIPALVNRWVDTAVEMRAGQTLALAGLIQDRIESQNRGLPILSDLPYAGALFRRVVQKQNEVELLVLVRPEFVDAMDPEQVPMFGPGEHTAVPDDKEMYLKGYVEVPACCPDGSCRHCRPGRGKFAHPGMYAPGTEVQGGYPPSYGVPANAGPVNVGPYPAMPQYQPPASTGPLHPNTPPPSNGVPADTSLPGDRSAAARSGKAGGLVGGSYRSGSPAPRSGVSKPGGSFFRRTARKLNLPLK